jgi:hypothetical protein
MAETTKAESTMAETSCIAVYSEYKSGFHSDCQWSSCILNALHSSVCVFRCILVYAISKIAYYNLTVA